MPKVLITLAGLLLGMSDSKMNDPRELFPPAMPHAETVVPNNDAFIEGCRSYVAEMSERLGWTFGNSTLTHSETWGLVWRVDYQVRGELPNSTYVKRLICWRPPGKEEGFGTATVVVLRDEQ